MTKKQRAALEQAFANYYSPANPADDSRAGGAESMRRALVLNVADVLFPRGMRSDYMAFVAACKVRL